MLKIDRPIIVEGRYDKIKIASIAEAVIITTDGFSVFSSEEKKLLIRRLAEKNGVIVMTDSDGAGMKIRNFIKNILQPGQITNLYTPEVKGKERRKKEPSKAGLLGVEGTDADVLRQLLLPYSIDADEIPHTMTLQKSDLYALGLSGTANSAEYRSIVLDALQLPSSLSANALLEAVNMVITEEAWQQALIVLHKAKEKDHGGMD